MRRPSNKHPNHLFTQDVTEKMLTQLTHVAVRVWKAAQPMASLISCASSGGFSPSCHALWLANTRHSDSGLGIGSGEHAAHVGCDVVLRGCWLTNGVGSSAAALAHDQLSSESWD